MTYRPSKQGFDIVVGNPPYKILTVKNTPSEILNQYKNGYLSIKSSSSKNLFSLFIEMSITRLLTYKGVMSFIVPEGLFKTRSYKGCTDIINKNGIVNTTVTFTDYVFENAITGSLIFVFNKDREMPKELHNYYFDSNYNLNEQEILGNSLFSKIEQGSVPLKSVAELFKGMVVQGRKGSVFKERGNNPDVFLLGKSIAKWEIKVKFYTDYDKIIIIGGTKKLHKYKKVPRILIRRTGSSLCCALLEEKALTESTLYSCWPISQSKLETKCLLGILNSKLLNFYNQEMNITNKQGFPQILMTDLENLPIKIPTIKIQNYIVEIVKNILSLRQDNCNDCISDKETEIDFLVYHLYNLTYDEIKIVDPSTTISREDFNAFSLH